MVYGDAYVNKNARISNHAIIYNNACINGKVGGIVYGYVKGSCTLGSDVIIGEDVDFDCSISEKLALESNDDFVYVRCGKFLYVKSKDRFFGEFPNRDESERIKKIIKTI